MTKGPLTLANFGPLSNIPPLKELKILALTHKELDLESLGKFHIEESAENERLTNIKAFFGMDELVYLATCNRVEIIFTCPEYFCLGRIRALFEVLTGDSKLAGLATTRVRTFEGEAAAEHLMRVAASLDSMIIGEREIITQVRKAFEKCRDMGLTGDMLRLLMRKVIETAKTIYDQTDIARKPVSVVSLAWHRFLAKRVPHDARIVMVGAGQVMTNFGRFLAKTPYKNIVVANRSIENAERLAKMLKAKPMDLESLNTFKEGFDVMITCTGAGRHIIDRPLYTTLLAGENCKKTVIDLALPQDLDPALTAEFDIDFTGMVQLKTIADENIGVRARETERCEAIIAQALSEFEAILKERKVELAMRQIPALIKEIRQTAIGQVFSDDLNALDDEARATLEKVMDYMEKKYIGLPMKMAKALLLDQVSKN